MGFSVDLDWLILNGFQGDWIGFSLDWMVFLDLGVLQDVGFFRTLSFSGSWGSSGGFSLDLESVFKGS